MAESEQSEPKLSPEERIAALNAPPPEEAPEETPAEASEEEAPAETPEETPEEDSEVLEVSSFSELQEHLGLDAEDLYKLSLPITVNGQRQEVTLSEIKDSITSREEAKRYQEEAKTAREEMEQAKVAAEEQYKAQLAQGAALVQGLEQQALQRFQQYSPERMEELRTSNPAEWAAVTTEMQKTQAYLNQVKQHVQGQIQQHQQQVEAQQKEAFDQHVAKELEALYKAWPEMADEKKGTAERSALVEELKFRGFSEGEISNAADHRILLMARDAMRWRQQAKQTEATKKKVLKIAKKVVKPGASRTKAEQHAEAVKPLRDRLRKSGSVHDAAALISLNRS